MDKCLDCHEHPRAGMGRWLCERCEDIEFGYSVEPAADMTAANMPVQREEKEAA